VETFLEKSRHRLGLESPVKSSPNVSVSSPDAPKIGKGLLKGLSTALLDKIRAKEASKLAKEMLRSPEDEKKLEMMQRLPEFIRILTNYFLGEKRAAIPLGGVVIKAKESYHTFMSPVDVQEHIKLLHQLLPDWLFLLEVRKGTFVKLDKNKQTQVLLERLDKIRDKLRGISC
jgi:chromatin licensing and DNA replication factor 1